MGEVITSWNRDGVFMGREPHLSLNHAMKPKTLILPFAALLLVGCSGRGGFLTSNMPLLKSRLTAFAS